MQGPGRRDESSEPGMAANRGKVTRRQFVFNDLTPHRRLSLPSLDKASPRLQVGIKSGPHFLRRQALKDTGNVPKVSAELCADPGSRLYKRRASDSESCNSSLSQQRKLRTEGMLNLAKGCIANENELQNLKLNLYNEESNNCKEGSVYIVNKDGNLDHPKAVCAEQNGVQSSEGIDHNDEGKKLPPKEQRPLFTSPTTPESCSLSKAAECSKTTPSYFTDLSASMLGEVVDSSQRTPGEAHKYFSTPMPSKVKPKKKLTPVMEVEFECNVSAECKNKGGESEIILQHSSTHVPDIKLHDSPTQVPLYRSFFATECLEIVNQLECSEQDEVNADQQTPPTKRKREEIDVSTIEAEPPPYDSTPMQSMLASEVANIFSTENSPNQEGPSLFGESLLDLEKMNMQLCDFSKLMDDCKSRSDGPLRRLCKDHSLDDDCMEGIEFLGEGFDEASCCSELKDQKMDESEREVKDINGTIGLHIPVDTTRDRAVVLQIHGEYDGKASIQQCTEHYSTMTNVGDLKMAFSKEKTDGNFQSKRECSMLDMKKTQVLLSVDKVTAANVTEVIPLTEDWVSLHNTILNSVSMEDPLAAASASQIIDDDPKESANNTQDIVLLHNEIPDANATQIIELLAKTSTNITLDIESLHNVTNVNTTQIIEVVSKTFATSPQHIGSVHNEILDVNTTQVIDVLAKPSVNTTQDLGPLHNEVTDFNTTEIIDVMSKPSANITQDIGSFPIEDMAVNTTQVLEVVSKPSANTTRDIESMDEVTAANTTQVIEVLTKPSANTTQDIGSLVNVCAALNTTRVIEVESKDTVNPIQDTCSLNNEATALNTIQVMDSLQNPSNTTLDVELHHEVTTANVTQSNEIVFKHSADTTQDIGSLNSESYTVHINKYKNIHMAGNAKDTAMLHNQVTVANTTQVSVSLQAEEKEARLGNDSVEQLVIATNTTQDCCDQCQSNAVPDINPTVQQITMEAVTTQDPGPTTEEVTRETSFCIEKTLHKDLKEASTALTLFSANISTKEKSLCGKGMTDEAKQSIDLFQEGSCTIQVTTGNDSQLKELVEIHELTKEPTKCHTSVDHNTLVCTLVQSSQEGPRELVTITESVPKEAVSSVKIRSEMSAKENGSSPKELLSDPETLEMCDRIQEGESMHNESVFSCRSLCFVTSTPLSGILNFNFRKTSGGDPSLSICSVVEEPTNKETLEKNAKTQQEPVGLQAFRFDSHARRGISRGSLLPPNSRRSVQPQAEGASRLPQSSTIPSARRSLALNTDPEPAKLAKGPALSRLPPRGSKVPGRGIRPPMARSSLQKQSMGISRQSIGGLGGGDLKNETAGYSFHAPKELGQSLENKLLCKPVEVTGCIAVQSQLPKGSTLVRPPSRQSLIGSGRFSLGGPNTSSSLQDSTRGPRMSVLRPPAPSGVKTSGLLRPGQSALRPPLALRSKKISPETKSNLPAAAPLRDDSNLSIAPTSSAALRPPSTRQRSPNTNILPSPKRARKGLPTKKSPKAVPLTKLSVAPTKSTHPSAASVETFSAESNNLIEAIKPEAKETTCSEPSGLQQAAGHTGGELHPSAATHTVTHTATDVHSSANIAGAAFSGSAGCCSHQETCLYCHKKIQQLLQELEEARNKLGSIQPKT